MTSPFSPLPDNLPDHRTAERLLDILHQLEGAVTSGHLGGHAPAEAAPGGELARLKAENARLHKRRKQALQRLDALIRQVQQQFDLTQTEQTQEPAA